jgi:hypothetical protein
MVSFRSGGREEIGTRMAGMSSCAKKLPFLRIKKNKTKIDRRMSKRRSEKIAFFQSTEIGGRRHLEFA